MNTQEIRETLTPVLIQMLRNGLLRHAHDMVSALQLLTPYERREFHQGITLAWHSMYNHAYQRPLELVYGLFSRRFDIEIILDSHVENSELIIGWGERYRLAQQYFLYSGPLVYDEYYGAYAGLYRVGDEWRFVRQSSGGVYNYTAQVIGVLAGQLVLNPIYSAHRPAVGDLVFELPALPVWTAPVEDEEEYVSL